MGLESLRGRRDRAKLKWWYKLVSMPEDRYPKPLFSREWETKPRRGRQWGRVVDELFVSLGLDKQRQRTWGGRGGLSPPHFSIRGAEPPKIGGCHEEHIKY